MHKHRKIKGNSRFGSLCGPGRLFCFSMAKKRCLCYTCLSDREIGEQLVHRPHPAAYPEKEHDLK